MSALSIVVPAYNAGSSLNDCLESLAVQKFQDLDIIVIDDGSTDDTLRIAQDWSEKDHRIRVISQTNQGTSAARNAGIEQAAGKYLTFVDADDMVTKETYSIAMSKMREDTEILSFGVSIDFLEEGYSKRQKLAESTPADSKENQIQNLFANDNFNYIWNKIYRRSLLGDSIRFPLSHNQGEDLVFNCLAFSNAVHIQGISDILYHYRKQSGATMVSRYTERSEYVLQAKKSALLTLLKSVDNPVFCDYILREYEVFTINLFLPGNNLSQSQRAAMIRKRICQPDAQTAIRKGHPAYFNGRLFRTISLSNSASFIAASYAFLNWAARTFRGFYHGIRRHTYQSDSL